MSQSRRQRCEPSAPSSPNRTSPSSLRGSLTMTKRERTGSRGRERTSPRPPFFSPKVVAVRRGAFNGRARAGDARSRRTARCREPAPSKLGRLQADAEQATLAAAGICPKTDVRRSCGRGRTIRDPHDPAEYARSTARSTQQSGCNGTRYGAAPRARNSRKPSRETSTPSLTKERRREPGRPANCASRALLSSSVARSGRVAVRAKSPLGQ